MSTGTKNVGWRSLARGGLSVHSVAAMLLLVVMWGLSIPATTLGLETLPPLTLTALRFVVAVPLLIIFALSRLQVPWRALPSIAALGVLGISVGQVAQAFGAQGTSASRSATAHERTRQTRTEAGIPHRALVWQGCLSLDPQPSSAIRPP
jgi:xanthosine utilization system XapX-like protein